MLKLHAEALSLTSHHDMKQYGKESREDIIEYCRMPPEGAVLSTFDRKVIRFHDMAVKFGPDITRVEAENQRTAYRLINPAIVRVPKVYDFFDSEGQGYIVMEFVDGKSRVHFDSSAREKIEAAFQHFSTLGGESFGNLCGFGPLCMYPFPDTGASLGSLDELDRWCNCRLLQGSVSFHGRSTVLCHRDFAPRNLLWCGNDLFVLDWALAGFYPPSFEVCAQKNGRDMVAIDMLLSIHKAPSLSAEADLLTRIWSNSIRYALYDAKEPSHLLPLIMNSAARRTKTFKPFKEAVNHIAI